jgi:hypothetical protein
VCEMMTGEYVAISAALLGTVSLACMVIFCQFENMIKKRLSAIRAIRQAEGAAVIPPVANIRHPVTAAL